MSNNQSAPIVYVLIDINTIYSIWYRVQTEGTGIYVKLYIC